MNISIVTNKKVNILIAYIFTFILLYNPQIYGFPTQRILYPLSLLYFILVNTKLFPDEKKLLLLAILCVSLGFSNALIQDTADFGMLLISRVFFGVLCANMIFDLLFKSKEIITEVTALKLVAYAGIFQSIIIILSFFVPDVKNILLQLNTNSPERDNVMRHLSMVRGIGWGTFQYAHLAIINGASLLCYIYIVATKKDKKIIPTIISFGVVLLYVIAGILSARTFFIILFIVVAYWSWLFIKKYGVERYLIKTTIGVFVLISSVVYLVSQFSEIISEDTLKWAFEFFYNFNENGNIRSGSTDVLATMWHFPDNLKTWLLGDARTAGLNGHYNYTCSDIGIVNSIYYWGLIGSFLYFLCLFKSFYYSENVSKVTNIKILIWLIFFINIGYQFKETLNLFPISCLLLRGEMLTNWAIKRGT